MLFHDINGKGSVRLEDARGVRARNAVHFEPQHDLSELLLLHVGSVDLRRRLLADARDLGEARGLLLDDLKRLLAELLHEAVRHRLADARDRARREEALDARETRRRRNAKRRRLELLAEARVLHPLARKRNLLPHERCGRIRRHRHESAPSRWPQAKDREAPLGRGKDDALCRPFERFHAAPPVPWRLFSFLRFAPRKGSVTPRALP